MATLEQITGAVELVGGKNDPALKQKFNLALATISYFLENKVELPGEEMKELYALSKVALFNVTDEVPAVSAFSFSKRGVLNGIWAKKATDIFREVCDKDLAEFDEDKETPEDLEKYNANCNQEAQFRYITKAAIISETVTATLQGAESTIKLPDSRDAITGDLDLEAIYATGKLTGETRARSLGDSKEEFIASARTLLARVSGLSAAASGGGSSLSEAAPRAGSAAGDLAALVAEEGLAAEAARAEPAAGAAKPSV